MGRASSLTGWQGNRPSSWGVTGKADVPGPTGRRGQQMSAPSALGILGPHASATGITRHQLARPPSLAPVNTQEL